MQINEGAESRPYPVRKIGEKEMVAAITHFVHGAGRLLRWIDRISKPQKFYFACGTCERNLRCGRPPDAQCVVMAMQLARGDNRVPPPPRGPLAL